ncbi:4-(cytidine 5'-diphospho)-2-C-methyl-D-erythritol kinase [Corynebacterium anserum]|uniref:4-(cytidine 5'-diphospho)-2-C-methyl-D-erythritol kinase n=1 Tax=Corynebacterium anserum TaxID=2684406 RepID=UPI0021AF1A2D|nr:4-(cytidine 5'-diphospho)-2-C-methyl-D-erythritol kinase [Corynebacterium anserum]
MSVGAVAHGKVNLHLGVSDLRDDGYHDLTTVFQSVALQEKVRLTEVASEEEATVTVTGHDAHLVPTDPSNLAVRAVEAVRSLVKARMKEGSCGDNSPGEIDRSELASHKMTEQDVPWVAIHIEKGVPVAGGMAGGSADAAAALVAAVEFYCERHPRTSHVPTPTMEEQYGIAASLGADVPFCVLGGTALGLGRGDELVTVMAHGTFHWALATDKRGLSTPKVFAQLDKQRAAAASGERPDIRAGSTDALMRALVSGDAEQLAPTLVNDLQAPAISLMPTLRETLRAAKEAGALAAIVSGSGPTIAMLCRDADHALDVATAVSVAGKASATITASSPAGPARILEED